MEKVEKKPLYKKWWFWVIVAFVGSAAIAGIAESGSSSPTTDKTDSSQAASKEEDKVEDADLEALKLKPQPVRNDSTGKWRISSIAKPLDVSKHAYAYYKNYFSSDDEVHAVVNFTYKTTTKFVKNGAGVCATVYEYVDGEEHNAKELFGGRKLTEKCYDPATGEEIVEQKKEEQASAKSTAVSKEQVSVTPKRDATTTVAAAAKPVSAKTSSPADTNATASDPLPLKAICKDGSVSYQDDPRGEDYRGMCSGHKGIKEKLGRVK